MKKKIWKKIVGLLCVFSLVVTSSGIENMGVKFGVTAKATQITENGIQWIENEDGTISVTRYVGNETILTIPESINGKKVSKIESLAFNGCHNLMKINLSEGLTIIEENAFFFCSNLTEINLPEGLISIGNNAFYECDLRKIHLPSSVNEVGDNWVGNNDLLTSIDVSPNNCNYISYDNCLYNKDLTELLTYPKGKTEINWSKELTSIGDYAFYECGLMEIILPEGVISIGKNAFSNNTLRKIKLPKELVSIGDYAFYECGLREIDLPEKLTNIGESAFSFCGDLTKIHLPEGLTTIEEGTFSCCYSLTEIDLPKGLVSIGDSAFGRCRCLTEITLPEGLVSIGNSAFDGCDLRKIHLPSSVNAVGHNWVSENDLLTNIDVSPDNSSYASYDNCLYNKDLTELLTCPEGKIEVNWSEKVTSIGNCAFSSCDLLTEITLPKGLINIGIAAFSECSGLTKVNFSEGLVGIGGNAFYNCDSLIEIALPEGLTDIEDMVFYNCDSLIKVALPEGLVSIGTAAFAWCNSLTEVNLPESLTGIGSFAFGQCKNLCKINLPKGLTSIVYDAFSNCPSLILYVIQDSYAEEYAKERNLPYKYYNSDEISSSQYSFIFYDEDKNTPISQDIKAIYNNQELENLEGKFVFGPVSGQDILSIEYKNQTYTYNLSAFEQGKTNIVHISVPSDTNTYTMKLYATQPFANLRTGSKIGLNAVLYKNGVIDTSSHQFSLIVSDNNIVTSELYTKENDMNGLAWELTGIREGTVTVTVTDTQTKAAASINLVVDDKAYTYSADYLTSPNFNKYLCTGFMYADSFKQTALDNGDILFSFNVYNSGYSSGAVEVYNANGKLKSAVHVKKYKENSSLSDFTKSAWSLICDITSGRLFQYNQESICKKTEIKVTVPNGGSVKLVSDWKESQIVAAYNMVDAVVGAMKMGKNIENILSGSSSLEETMMEKCYTKITDEIIKRQIGEMQKDLLTGYAEFWESKAVEQFMDNLKDDLFSTVTDTMLESMMLNDGNGLLKAIEKFFGSLDFDSIIMDAIKETAEMNGIPFALDVLGECLPTKEILKAAFAANKISSYLLNLAYIGKTTGIGSLDIVFKASDNQMYSMGVSAEGDMLNQNDNIVFHSYLIKDEDERFHSIENTVSELGKHFVVYDIGMKKNGEDVPVTGRIKVTMLVPDGFNPSCCRVYWIKEDGTYQFVKTTPDLEKGVLVFYTDHFSMYAIVEEENISGDVNGDGAVNIKDSALTRRHVAKWKVEIDLDAADVNKDGKVTIKDSALIRRYVAKWGVTLL